MKLEFKIICILLILVVLIYYFNVNNIDTFKTNDKDDNIILFVFLTSTCPHCINYDKNTHADLEKQLNMDNIKIKKVYAHDDSTELFNKYNIEFVPAAIVVKGDKDLNVNGNIDYNNVKKIVNSININK